MKNFLVVFLFGMLVLTSCQRSKQNCTTFNELPDPSTDTLAWDTVPKGLNVAYGSTDLRYNKSVPPDPLKFDAKGLNIWLGERVSLQLLVWTVDTLEQLECTVSKLKTINYILPETAVQARFVRYVMTDTFEPGCGYRKPEDFPASLSADMLDTISCIDMYPKTVRPIWISIDIPPDAKIGYYRGYVTIKSKNHKKKELPICFTVLKYMLPPPSEWGFHLDLWQHPAAVARVHNLKLWSDEHFEAMRPLMKMLADAGQKVITVTLNKDPWNAQCYDRYADMILWAKQADGNWKYDYTVFDKWVQFMMDLGIKKQINCYSLLPWNNEIHYTDAKGETINLKVDPGTKAFEEVWTPFLIDFEKHLRTKGWLSRTNIAMDERSPETMKAALGLLQKVSPDLGVALADNHESYKEYPYIKDLCLSWGTKIDREMLEDRRSKGLITTMYVCCAHKFPNVFTFSAPSEATYAPLYAFANGFDGYLRWAYNSWVENPELDSRFRTWPAGDTYIVYPGARSSIRFERLRDGIEDVEKIRVLRQNLQGKMDYNSKDRLREIEFIEGCFKRVNKIEKSYRNDLLQCYKRLNVTY